MREIRGWNIGEVVTAAYMKANTANLLEVIGSSGEPNLPCIYNGLSLASQSGTGGDTVTFNPGVARCQDLPLSVFTYLPPNPYGTSYPCFIDISTLDANKTIVLDPAITSGYIVATFAISPTTPDATNYVITGSLMQIATGSYDPTHQVRLCSFVYAIFTFTLDFTPETSRDTDLTGLGSVQWNYQTSNLEIMPPASQGGTAPVDFPTGITTDSFIVPIQEVFTSSGIYTTPISQPRKPLYLEVYLAGGAGGGSSGGDSGSGFGADGTLSSFGTILVANGGEGGDFAAVPGTGGTATISLPAVGVAYRGQEGQTFQFMNGIANLQLSGGIGGQNMFSGQGLSSNAIPNTGCGGAGGVALESVTPVTRWSGTGGGAGGSLKAIIPTPSAAYNFIIGTGGIGGISIGGGTNGTKGSDGTLIVTAHYQ